MAESHSPIPVVSDDDVEWISGVMNLRELDPSRQAFLRDRTTLDVAACPGSGKTTLIVAKLAIMARKWPYRTKGICVLSHTNAAREEIQRRLCGTVVGQHLLSYPHFIDTIHGFVNRFLALPWLNSNGFPSPTIDDDVTYAYRCRALTRQEYRQLDDFLQKKNSGLDKIRLADRDLRLCLGSKPFPAGPDTAMHKIARRAVEASSKAGYFCYDEMFVWANALLSDHPEVSTSLQRRFPLVIIDEMQDASPIQVAALDSVFPRSASEVVLQRVGDPNQELYDATRAQPAAAPGFPDAARCLSIPNSFRFGPEIAALASPFASDPVGPDGLQGAGPRRLADAPKRCANAVFIFPSDSTDGVLDAYGRHVLATFSNAALLEADVTAVGAVHQDAREVLPGHAHFPKTLPHYWSGYSAEVSQREPHPRTLIQCIRAAQAVVRDRRDLFPGVDMIAAGLVRLARRAGGAELLGRRAPKHRGLVDALVANLDATAAYRRLLRAFLIDWKALTPESWRERQVDILSVAAALNSRATSEPADSFLLWDDQDPSLKVPAAASPRGAGPNVYRVDDGTGRSVDIRLGSVHSVKGQTHLSTLLVSTYWYDHSSTTMLPWLLGKRSNRGSAGERDRKRLMQTFVAMTRPSHLVCIAVPRFALGDDATLTGHVATLKARGWQVADVIAGRAQWYS
jgi:DNA helicase-2/ATP-dependent DNA helicase PcrA